MTNIINFPDLSEASADWHPFDNFDDGDPEPITEEILVEFLIAHGIECATDLEKFSYTCTSLEIGFGPGKYSSNSSDPH